MAGKSSVETYFNCLLLLKLVIRTGQGIVTQDFLDECNKKVKNWSDEEKNAFIHDIENIMKGIIQAMENDVIVSSDEVQELMNRHYHWLTLTWTPNKESYLGLTELYQTPEFRKCFDTRHPQLLSYIIEAMKIYAKNKL